MTEKKTETVPFPIRFQTMRVNVQKKCNKKSGKNTHIGFTYFELGDFLLTANEEMLNQGMYPTFQIRTEENLAELVVQDFYSDSHMRFTLPLAEARVGGSANPIQQLGAMNTYLKRYLYLNALELAESDVVDASSGVDAPAEKKEERKCTEKQAQMILNSVSADQLVNILGNFKVDKVEELTIAQASDVIKKIKERSNG